VASEIPEILKKRLKEANITKAAIIDDAFDGISNEALSKDLSSFMASLEEEAVFNEAQAICGDLEDASDFDLDRAKQLWEANARWGANLKGPAALLFNVYNQRLATLNQLASNLEHLGLAIQKCGVRADVPLQTGLIFLDYYLQPETEAPSQSTLRAQLTETGSREQAPPTELLAERIAKKIGSQGGSRPFLVLISDKADVSVVRDAFRQRTNYLAGTFACLSKTKASNQETLYLHLGSWGVGHPALGPAREFFDAVTNSIDKTASAFKECLLALDVQDYSFIQRLSLGADGEPLGEYMLEMIGAALSHRLRAQGEVCNAKKTLDRQHFGIHLPSVTQPSLELRRLYRDATTEPNVNDLEPHPLQEFQDPPPKGPIPRLVLGDILAKTEDELVYMVANAGCDLQFSPINPNRHADPDLPIYLMPGKLEPLSRSTADPAAKRTELFDLEGKPYRILWDQGHVFSVPLGEMQKWCADRNYHRVDRIGLVYALAMQQLWTSSISRVGLMVTPPLTETADFKMYIRNGAGKLEAHGTRVKGQVILGTSRRKNADVDWFFLTTDGMEHVLSALKDAPKLFEAFAQALPDGPHKTNKQADLRRWSESAAAAASRLDSWLGLLEKEHTLTRADGTKLKSGDPTKMPITFCWQTYPGGKPLSDFGGGNILMVVDILRPEAPDEPNRAVVNQAAPAAETVINMENPEA